MMEIETENFIPKENWCISLLFDEGYFTFQTLRKQQLTRYKPYLFNSGVEIASGGTSGWETPTDANARRYLEPQEEETIYQTFMGICPSQAKIYLQYTQRVDRMNLIVPRPVPGVFGFWDGYTSLYDDPAPETELWTVHDLYPHFNAENPAISGKSVMVAVAWYVNAYTYKVVKESAKSLQIIRKEKPGHIRTMGDGDRPIKAPAWLLRRYQQYMIKPEEV
jgi:hypothetical protein